MKKKICFLFLSFLLFSCNDENDIYSELEEIGSEKFDAHFIPCDYAEYIAINYQDNYDTDFILTKPIPAKKIKKTITQLTKQGEVAFYIFNYEEGGFVIVSADNRLMPILAEVENGEFSYEDVNFPPALQMWLDEIGDFIANARQNNIESTDEVKQMWEKISPIKTKCTNTWTSDCEFEFESVFDYIRCRSRVINTNWHQSGGYNDMMGGNCSGEQYYLGCSTLATGIAMRYYQKPTSLNWANMPLDRATTTTATFLRDLSVKIGVTPGCSSTPGPLSGMVNALKSYGYSNTQLSTYNALTVLSQVHTGWVVILYGVNSLNEAHAWVVSGVEYTEGYECMYNPKRVLTPYATGVKTPMNFHINWGWGPNYDGWFHVPHGYSFPNNMWMITGIY